MKKKVLSILLALVAIATTARAQVIINATNFPDEKFRNWLLQQDYGKDGKLTTTEIAATTTLDVSKSWNTLAEEKIADLTGIEYFTALTVLDCGWNKLTSLDVSKNTALEKLFCERNELIKLDVLKNTALTTLSCNFNQLTALDVSKNTKLTQLQCIENKLTALDVSGCTNLQIFHCYNNQIKGDKMLALVNSLPKVSSGYFIVIDTKDSNEQNVITKSQVAIAKGKNWKVLNYYNDNYVEYEGSDPTDIAINATNFPDANFRSFVSSNYDTDKNGYLSTTEIAAVPGIKVESKNIANLKGIEFFTGAQYLYCQDNQLTSLDVSKNTKLMMLFCYDNRLTKLDVSKNTKLKTLNFQRNQVASIDLSKNTALTGLYCNNNKLTALDVSKSPNLTTLYCHSNQIKGSNMQTLVNSLPTVSDGKFRAIDTKDSNEQNVITKSQVKIATDKGWTVYDYNNGSAIEYAGSDDTPTSIETNHRETIANNDYYTIDGVKLNGEPTKAGIYIRNGKKVVK